LPRFEPEWKDYLLLLGRSPAQGNRLNAHLELSCLEISRRKTKVIQIVLRLKMTFDEYDWDDFGFI